MSRNASKVAASLTTFAAQAWARTCEKFFKSKIVRVVPLFTFLLLVSNAHGGQMMMKCGNNQQIYMLEQNQSFDQIYYQRDAGWFAFCNENHQELSVFLNVASCKTEGGVDFKPHWLRDSKVQSVEQTHVFDFIALKHTMKNASGTSDESCERLSRFQMPNFECGNLCDKLWLEQASANDLQAELTSGSAAMAWHHRGWSTIHFAAIYGSPEQIQILLNAGVNVMARSLHEGGALLGEAGWTPLHWAARWGTPQKINVFLKAGADINAQSQYGYTPLHSAAKSNTPENILTLIEAGADVTAKGRLSGHTPLHTAAYLGNPESIRILIQNDADLMARGDFGDTPLHWAARYGSSENINALIDAGASVMARSTRGETPLHWAATEGMKAHIINTLVAAGANVMAKDVNKWTPLHNAAYSGESVDIHMLIEAGADVLALEESGDSPLHLAASAREDFGTIEALLASGANAKLENRKGQTPWDIVRQNEQLRDTKGYWALNDARFE